MSRRRALALAVLFAVAVPCPRATARGAPAPKAPAAPGDSSAGARAKAMARTGGVTQRTLTFFSGPGPGPGPGGGVTIDVVGVDLRRARLRLVWRRETGEPLGSLRAARDWLVAQGERPVALTNAGIYGRDDAPLGLHVEDGRELHRLDRGRGGGGNFYLKPNGVFFIDAGGASILETTAFAARPRPPRPRLATQSGPLLVFRRRIHPRFSPASTSTHVRNAVCVRDRNHVQLAVTRDPITFHAFARFLRDRLGCTDALYLDGTISRLHAPALGRSVDRFLGGLLGDGHFVGILAVLDGAE